jgi:2-(1,2-epoxy-1,2-dihydrophenyl)acetyl-CoA isomerase
MTDTAPPAPSPSVRVDWADDVATVTLRRAPANALDIATANDLVSALQQTEDAAARVLTGEGRIFCAGADRDCMAGAARDGSLGEFVEQLLAEVHLAVRLLAAGPVTVAALNGSAVGGGLGLALACDQRIAVDGTRLLAGFAALGLSPDSGVSYFLPRLAAPRVARAIVLNDTAFGAGDALAEGLVDGVVTDDCLAKSAHDRACELARLTPATLRAARGLYADPAELAAHLDMELRQIVKASEHPAALRRLAASGHD